MTEGPDRERVDTAAARPGAPDAAVPAGGPAARRARADRPEVTPERAARQGGAAAPGPPARPEPAVVLERARADRLAAPAEARARADRLAAPAEAPDAAAAAGRAARRAAAAGAAARAAGPAARPAAAATPEPPARAAPAARGALRWRPFI